MRNARIDVLWILKQVFINKPITLVMISVITWQNRWSSASGTSAHTSFFQHHQNLQFSFFFFFFWLFSNTCFPVISEWHSAVWEKFILFFFSSLCDNSPERTKKITILLLTCKVRNITYKWIMKVLPLERHTYFIINVIHNTYSTYSIYIDTWLFWGSFLNLSKPILS